MCQGEIAGGTEIRGRAWCPTTNIHSLSDTLIAVGIGIIAATCGAKSGSSASRILQLEGPVGACWEEYQAQANTSVPLGSGSGVPSQWHYGITYFDRFF